MTGKLITSRGFDPFATPYRPRMPVSAYALAATRHMHEFATTREQRLSAYREVRDQLIARIKGRFGGHPGGNE